VLSVLKRNDSLCDSNATYGATPGYVENMSNMNMGMMNSKLEMDMVHISNMSACRDVGRMRRGQNWSVKASYDFTQHALILDMESGYGDCIALMLRRRGGETVIRITDGCYNERVGHCWKSLREDMLIGNISRGWSRSRLRWRVECVSTDNPCCENYGIAFPCYKGCHRCPSDESPT
jgi:hypothetical protein